MISSRSLICLVISLLLTRLVAVASENSDLSLIPEAIQKEKSRKEEVEEQSLAGKIFFEDVLSVWSLRGGLYVPSPVTQPDWQNRTSLNLDQTWKATDHFLLHLSDRFDIVEESDFNFSSNGLLRNNFQEGFGSVEVFPGAYFEAGRINLKNGISLGFNPTDYFKTRSAVSQASSDPSLTREYRMGAFMIRGQEIWESGSISLSYAPKIASVSAIPLSAPAILDPLIGQTNAANRWLMILSHDLADLNPQLLIYNEQGHFRYGFNLSHVIGKSVVVYAEWSGGDQSNLSVRAVDFGKQTGALPQAALPFPQTDPGVFFQNDASLGFSWAGIRKITINVEYHYHQSGFEKSDLDRWFTLGAANPLLVNELWYVRLYANDQQEPLMQQEVFLRADWQDALITNLSLNGFVLANPYDGSMFFQFSGSYFLSRQWTVAGYIGATLGVPNSEYGSLTQDASASFQLVRYF